MFLSHDGLWVLVLALLFDSLIGDPAAVWGRWPHPVVFMGRLIAALDERYNGLAASDMRRRFAGILVLMILVIAAVAIGLGLQVLLGAAPFGRILTALLASILIAQRSLYDHIADVRRAFGEGGIELARIAVARVVGRDPNTLDEAAVSRAAIESCAENFSDGVVAPAFWFVLCGLPGLIVYKTVNTADSMIGHRTPRHEAFGWASARFDDLLNIVPARLSGFLFVCVAPAVGGRIGEAFAVMMRDAHKHRSPNAGWPESAAAGVLGVALSGPRQYAGRIADEPFLNQEGRTAQPRDIARALKLLLAACCLEILLYAALALAV